MGFKKLALAAAVAAAPMSALALEPMQDDALSDVTGRDGITIGLATDISAGLKIHDTDGLANGAGALVIDGFAITRANTTDQISLIIDADDGNATGTDAPYLNIQVSLPADLSVNLGTLGVASSGRDDTTPAWSTANTVSSIVTLGTLTLGATTMNIQLGNEPQGNMIALNTSITGGVSLSGFSVSDAGGSVSGGSLTTDLSVVDSGGANLTVNTGIDISASGLVIGLDNIGDATNGIDVRMANLTLGNGSASALGDVELIGLDLTGNLIISGH